MEPDKPASYKVEVIADNSGKWCSNSLRFADAESAQTYGYNLANRWLAVREWRVAESDEAVNR